MYLLLKIVIFHCHVSFRGGKHSKNQEHQWNLPLLGFDQDPYQKGFRICELPRSHNFKLYRTIRTLSKKHHEPLGKQTLKTVHPFNFAAKTSQIPSSLSLSCWSTWNKNVSAKVPHELCSHLSCRLLLLLFLPHGKSEVNPFWSPCGWSLGFFVSPIGSFVVVHPLLNIPERRHVFVRLVWFHILWLFKRSAGWNDAFPIKVTQCGVKKLPSLKQTVRPWKWWFPIGISFSRGLFSGAMLVSGRVSKKWLIGWVSHPLDGWVTPMLWKFCVFCLWKFYPFGAFNPHVNNISFTLDHLPQVGLNIKSDLKQPPSYAWDYKGVYP